MSRAFIDFALEHRHDDTARLLLSASRYPGVDMHAAVQQIEGLAAAERKWPSLLQCSDFVYPPRLNREQASSEASARYKATLAGAVERVADLTGGMGIDCMALAAVASEVDYVERDPMLCELMEHNCRALGIGNIAVHCADSIEWLAAQSGRHDLLMIDPARRDAYGRKAVSISDCTPDVAALQDLLLEKAEIVMVKLSPMLDISKALTELQHVKEVHVVAVANECKELDLVMQRGFEGEPQFVCVNLLTSQPELRFTQEEERNGIGRIADGVSHYLYEPNPAVLKAGCFKLLTHRYDVFKLHKNSNLYTSVQLVPDFPGRIFEVEGWAPYNKKVQQTLLRDVDKASIAVRNFPLSVAELRKSLKIGDGDETYLFATTLKGEQKVVIRTKKTAS